MRVGTIDVKTPVLLAPMAAVTDLPFRTIVEEFGVGLTITEFLSADAIDHGDTKTTDKMTASLHGRKFGVQIFGRTDDAMSKAAKLAVKIGASLVDINMGCPAKRVVAGACGSALMREPELAAHLVRVVDEAVGPDVHVTVKHRAGWDMNSVNAPEFACAMVEAGAKMITVHGRTRSQGFTGHSSNEVIRKVRQQVPAHIPVVGNGDVVCVETYQRMREETGCDAVMIGRGALGNPWLFRSIKAVHEGRADPGAPSIEERYDVFRRHISHIIELKQGPKILHEVRKASAWYAKGHHGCNALRQKVWKTREPEAILDLVSDYFEDLIRRRAAA
jgi:nifR3 family TIM-barrel protein